MDSQNNNSGLIAMRSLTQALRARDILSKHGIRSTLVRTHDPHGGCGYGLNIPKNKRRAQELIESALGLAVDHDLS